MRYRTLIVVATLILLAGCTARQPASKAQQGEALLNAGDYDEAIATLSEAILLNPRDSKAYLHRGRAYQCRDNEGDLDAAIADLTTASDLAPEDPEPLYSRAIAYRDRGKATGSTEDAKQALADQAAARGLDPAVAASLAAMPDTSPPPEIETHRPPLDDVSPQPVSQDEPVESAADALRRIEARAAAAQRQERRGTLGTDEPQDGRLRSFSSSLDDQRDRGDSDPPNQQGRVRSRDRFNLPRRDRLPTIAPGGELSDPTLDSRYSLPAPSAADPLPGSLDTRRAAPTRGSDPTPRPNLGGTLPPVANSPFAPPAPYQPLPAGAATATSPNALPGSTPYRSPFSSRPPQPTGRLPRQSLDSQPAQPRSFYSPYPRPTNHPPTVEHYDYNP